MAKHSQFDEIQFDYEVPDWAGRTVYVEAFGKVIPEDHTGTLSMSEFFVKVWPSENYAADDSDEYTRKDLPGGAWDEIEHAAAEKLFTDFENRRQDARDEREW